MSETANVHGSEWRPHPHGWGWLTCGYCGSLEPLELLKAFGDGKVAKWSGSDWKYGWPHKFYIDLATGKPYESYLAWRIPDDWPLPNGAALVPGWIGQTIEVTQQEYDRVEEQQEIAYEALWNHEISEVPEHLRSTLGSGHKAGTGNYGGKFYTEHLLDLKDDREAFAALNATFEERLFVSFQIITEDGIGRLKYSAPRHGFQTWGPVAPDRPAGPQP